MPAIGLILISAAIGYWIASTQQKRVAGGKTVKQLTEEQEAYRVQVDEHFQATANLLNEMTDKYRDIYRHMAEGAQKPHSCGRRRCRLRCFT